MYASDLDQEEPVLEFPFDPRRKYNQAENYSSVNWLEYPYKEKMMDQILKVDVRLNRYQAAGALLIARGVVTTAEREVRLSNMETWKNFENRFNAEKQAFIVAKKEYLKKEVETLRCKYKKEAQREKGMKVSNEREKNKLETRVKRFENGDKYDGEVLVIHDVELQHGQGTFWIPEYYAKSNVPVSVKHVKRYSGMWKNGKKHGTGTYWFDETDSALGNGRDSWEGTFYQDDMNGRGMYTTMDKEGNVLEARGRYYWFSVAICWEDELSLGCCIELLSDSVSSNVHLFTRHHIHRIQDTTLDVGRMGRVVDYNRDTGKHCIELDAVTRHSQWISLSKVAFQVMSTKPVTYYLQERDLIPKKLTFI